MKEVRLAFVETAKAIRTHSLNNAHVNVCVVRVHEYITLQMNKSGEDFEIMIQQTLPQFRRQIGLRIIKQRRDVILQGAFTPALIIDEERLPVLEHDVARLKVAIQKIVVIRRQQELRQSHEIIFKCLFVEGNAG